MGLPTTRRREPVDAPAEAEVETAVVITNAGEGPAAPRPPPTRIRARTEGVGRLPAALPGRGGRRRATSFQTGGRLPAPPTSRAFPTEAAAIALRLLFLASAASWTMAAAAALPRMKPWPPSPAHPVLAEAAGHPTSAAVSPLLSPKRCCGRALLSPEETDPPSLFQSSSNPPAPQRNTQRLSSPAGQGRDLLARDTHPCPRPSLRRSRTPSTVEAGATCQARGRSARRSREAEPPRDGRRPLLRTPVPTGATVSTDAKYLSGRLYLRWQPTRSPPSLPPRHRAPRCPARPSAPPRPRQTVPPSAVP